VYEIFYRFYKRPPLSLLLQALILAVPLYLNAQSNRLDSLNRALVNSKGLDRVDIQIELARANYFVDANLALENINGALNDAIEQGDNYRIIKSSRLKGQILRKLERLEDAINIYESTYNSAKKMIGTDSKIDEEIITILNSLGLAYTLVANYDKALDLHFQALILKEKNGDLITISDTYGNIGLVYFKLKNYDKSLEYYKKSLAAKMAVQDTYYLDRLYINMGLCYVHLKEFDKALETINEGFVVCGEDCSDEILMEGNLSIGIANYWLGNFNESFNYLNKALSIAKKTDNKRFQVESLVYLSRVQQVEGKYNEAEALLKECEKIATEIGYNQLLMDTYREYSKLYSRAEDFKQASIYQDKYIALKDSLVGEELIKNIARTQTQFEERENLRTIEMKDEALARQRMLNLAIGTIAFLAALLVFVLYHNNKIRRRVNARLSITNAKLAEANATIEAQNKQLQSYNDKLEAEVEKATADLLIANTSLEKVNKELDNFIYKTSHDIRGPLASLKGMCNVALMDVKDQLALGYLQKLDETATKLNRILTRLLIINQINSAAIHPEPLDMDKVVDDIILLESKKGLPQGFQFRRDIQRNMIFRSDDALIRIILENLIDNAIKFHNDSGRVVPFAHIKIFIQGPNMHIHVIDNGVGIALENPDKIFQMFTRASEKSGTGGLGLYLIKQAVTRLGGDVGLQLTSDGFTEFYATLPLEIPKELAEPSSGQEAERTKASA
jgi:signal transduction histidine kinase